MISRSPCCPARSSPVPGNSEADPGCLGGGGVILSHICGQAGPCHHPPAVNRRAPGRTDTLLCSLRTHLRPPGSSGAPGETQRRRTEVSERKHGRLEPIGPTQGTNSGGSVPAWLCRARGPPCLPLPHCGGTVGLGVSHGWATSPETRELRAGSPLVGPRDCPTLLEGRGAGEVWEG